MTMIGIRLTTAVQPYRGATLMAALLANALAQKGASIELIAKGKGPLPLPLDADVKLLRTVDEEKTLRLRLQENPPRSLLAFGGGGKRLAAALRPQVSKSTLFCARFDNACLLPLARRPLALFFAKRRLHRLFPLDLWLAISQGLKEELEALGGPPVVAIPNPIDLEKAISLSQESPAHPWLAEKTCPAILGAGALIPQKDFSTLLRAFAIARRVRPLRLLILGDGPLASRLKSQAFALGIEKDMHLAGFVPQPFGWMRQADVFVLSSRFEGFGNVLLEALAAQGNCVATRCPHGPEEILEGGRLGRLVPVGNEKALAQAILEAVDAPKRLEDPRSALASYEAQAIAQRYLEAMGMR